LLARDKPALAHAIKVSCECKAAIVAMDEREGGIRAILNLGHTFGHAIETAMGYGAWLHGEAVATGMVMAADLSARLGMISTEQALSVKQLLVSAGLPVIPPAAIDEHQYLALMAKDKKSDMGKIRFILLSDLGQAVVRGGIDASVLSATLNAGIALCESD
jgi:3-dehydroquinate synthase